jgi:hypothetical protein
MDTQRTGTFDAGSVETPLGVNDRVVMDTSPTRSATVRGPISAVGENVLPARNRVQWGPIIAGLLTTIATMLILSVLGLAIGTSAFEPRDSGDTIGKAAAIWGAVSAIIAFFLGGWVAAKTAAVGGGFSGLMQGLMVGATALALILYLTGSGLGNLFGTVGSNLGEIANVAQDQAQTQGVDTTAEQQAEADKAATDAKAKASDAVSTVKTKFLDAENSAWGTLAGLVLALGSGALGGLLGHNSRRDLIQGTG